METINKCEALPVLLYMVDSIKKNKDLLSEIDGLIGDGDHGINMNKGFVLFEKTIDRQHDDLSTGFKKLGNILLSEIGGSMGPLYGSMFLSMSKAAKEYESIDQQIFLNMMEAGLGSVKKIGNAQIGEKTLVDVLEPAVASFKASVQAGNGFSTSLRIMCASAETGLKSTIDMVAKQGRSSRLGERSRGVQDAGATSCYILICAIANALISLLQ